MITFSEHELKKFSSFITTEGKRILFYHGDPDGVCSAALLLKYFPDLEYAPCEGPIMSRTFMNELKEAQPTLLIFVDIPADQEWKKLAALKKSLPELKTIIIDHHTVHKNLNGTDTLHINPRFADTNAYIPASFIVYQLMKKLGHSVTDYCWIAAIGIIGDYAHKEFKEFLTECERTHKNLEHTFRLVSAGISAKGAAGAHDILGIMLNARSCAAFTATKKLHEWKAAVEEEFKKCLREAKEHQEIHPDLKLRLYPVYTEMSLSSVIATYFSEHHPSDIVITMKRKGSTYKLSGRCQSGRMDVAELMKKAAQGIGAAGGHPKAAGGFVRDWNLFKKRLLKELKEQ